MPAARGRLCVLAQVIRPEFSVTLDLFHASSIGKIHKFVQSVKISPKILLMLTIYLPCSLIQVLSPLGDTHHSPNTFRALRRPFFWPKDNAATLPYPSMGIECIFLQMSEN